MSDQAALLSHFYHAFQARDGNAMENCYHPTARFSDPVFSDLAGKEVGAMWRMLCARGKDLRVEFQIVSADENTGQVRWEAWYTFSATGRQVHNIVDSHFKLTDGLISHHTDSFDFSRWARQALGIKGWLFGSFPFLQRKVQNNAEKALRDFMTRP